MHKKINTEICLLNPISFTGKIMLFKKKLNVKNLYVRTLDLFFKFQISQIINNSSVTNKKV